MPRDFPPNASAVPEESPGQAYAKDSEERSLIPDFPNVFPHEFNYHYEFLSSYQV